MEAIVPAARPEDVQIIGLSTLSGAHFGRGRTARLRRIY